MENKSINPNLFIASNTNLLDQLLLVAHSAKRSHEPAVSVISLSHIRRGRPVNKELRILKDFLYKNR